MKIKILAIILAMFTLNSCQSQGINGNGNVIKQQRSVGGYTQIASAGSADVILTDGTVGNIVVEGESNLVDLLVTETKGNVLEIRMKPHIGIHSSKQMKVYVPVNQIDKISSSGSGDISSEKNLAGASLVVSSSGSGDISLNSLYVKDLKIQKSGSGDFSSKKINSEKAEISISGSGDASLAGSANSLKISIAGSGNVNAQNLSADDVTVSIAGSGDVAVRAEKSLSANIAGSGDVRYTGNAAIVNQKIAGSGEITKF